MRQSRCISLSRVTDTHAASGFRPPQSSWLAARRQSQPPILATNLSKWTEAFIIPGI
jgi:hypothetical protein